MADYTNNPIFAQVLQQLSGAQTALNQVPQAAEQRRLNNEQIAREEARYQQTRQDTMTSQARQVYLDQLTKAQDALSQLDPTNPDDYQSVQRLNKVIKSLSDSLSLSGMEALRGIGGSTITESSPTTYFGDRSTLSVGVGQPGGQGGPATRNISMTPKVSVNRQIETPTGVALAQGQAQARAAGERRGIATEERAFDRQKTMAVLQFDQQTQLNTDQQAWQSFQNELNRRFQAGESSKQIASAMYQQAKQLNFDGSQGDLNRNIQQQQVAIQKQQADTAAAAQVAESKNLSYAQSANERDAFLKDIENLGPNDTEQAQAILTAAESAVENGTLNPSHLENVKSAIASRSGSVAKANLEKLRSDIDATDASTAAANAQANYTNFQVDRQKASDEQASITDAQNFVKESVALGPVGVATLQSMLGDLQNGNIENSKYKGFLKHLDEQTLQEAIAKAMDVSQNEDLTNQVFRAQSATTILQQRNATADEMASLFTDPQSLMDFKNLEPTDPKLANDVTLQKAWKLLQDPLYAGEVAARAAINNQARVLQQMGPQIQFSTSQLDFYSKQRPDDVSKGEDAVRAALNTLVRAQMFGDAADPEATQQQVEQVVSFYKQAWGDAEDKFNADMAESAARSFYQSSLAGQAKRTAEGGGMTLDQLKFQKDVIGANISAANSKADALGCGTTTASGVRTGGPECVAIGKEIAGYQTQYNDILSMSGYVSPSDAELKRVYDQVSAEVERDYPTANATWKDGEIQRRLLELKGGYNIVPSDPSSPYTQTPSGFQGPFPSFQVQPPPAPPAPPRTGIAGVPGQIGNILGNNYQTFKDMFKGNK